MMGITTDEKKIVLTWRTVVPIVAGMLILSNTVTGLIFNQEENTEKIGYNNDRTNRKFKSEMDETKQLIYIDRLETEIERLERHLKECEDE